MSLSALLAGCGAVDRSAPVATEPTSMSTSSTAAASTTAAPTTVAPTTVVTTVRAPVSTAEPATTAAVATPTVNPEVLRTAEERVLARFREHAASLLRNGYQAVGI
ncbi:MAG: hypothetical protein F2737_11010, partial [Actinobacteria bacterium]|nr:hypothetical protein [Actinomycetota bacterium]